MDTCSTHARRLSCLWWKFSPLLQRGYPYVQCPATHKKRHLALTFLQNFGCAILKFLPRSLKSSGSLILQSQGQLILLLVFGLTLNAIHRLCWYVGERYLKDLKAKEEFSPRILESIESLAQFLVNEARLMERPVDSSSKREAKDMVPADKVKDPCALARELRWRVRLAAGAGSGDEGRGKIKYNLDFNRIITK